MNLIPKLFLNFNSTHNLVAQSSIPLPYLTIFLFSVKLTHTKKYYFPRNECIHCSPIYTTRKCAKRILLYQSNSLSKCIVSLLTLHYVLYKGRCSVYVDAGLYLYRLEHSLAVCRRRSDEGKNLRETHQQTAIALCSETHF